MDATCTIQDSIHVFSLVHKYVSRILGTYHLMLTFLFCQKNQKTACIVLVTMLEYRSCVMKNPGFMPVLIYKYICKEVKKNA